MNDLHEHTKHVAEMAHPGRANRPRAVNRIGAGVVQVRRSSHRFVLLYVGAWASVADAAENLVTAGCRLLDSAEQRGARMEDNLLRRFRVLEEKTVDQLHHLQDNISLDDARVTLDEAFEQSQAGLTEQIQAVLDNLGIPSREQLDRLNREIDQLNAKIDRELQRQPVLA